MAYDLGGGYLDRAYTLLGEAKEASKRCDWALSVLRSAESVEFSLKAVLKCLGSEYKREHDVSGDLVKASDNVPEWFRGKIGRLNLISRFLTMLSIPAKYGDEVLNLSPKSLFERPEGEAYLQVAEQVYWDCSRLFNEMKNRVL